MPDTTNVVDKSGAIRQSPIVDGRVADWRPGSDLFHTRNEARIKRIAATVKASLEGKAVTRG